MDYVLVFLIVFIFVGMGIIIIYWVGRIGGYRLIEWYGKYVYLGFERYNKIVVWFEWLGSKLFVFVYFIFGVRYFVGYVLGSFRMLF